MTKNDPKSVTYLPVEEEFFTFFCFSLFSQQMAEKIGNEMQTQGIKMKRPAIPTKVCRFPSLPTETYSVWYYSLGQKVFRSFHFLTHRRPTLQICHHRDPSPHPSQVKDVQSGAKMFRLCFNIVCWAGRGKYVEWTVIYRDVFWILTYNVAIFLNTFVQDCRFSHYLLFSFYFALFGSICFTVQVKSLK